MEFSIHLILISFESACFYLLRLETAGNQLSLSAVWVLNNFQPKFNYGYSVSINSNISFVFRFKLFPGILSCVPSLYVQTAVMPSFRLFSVSWQQLFGNTALSSLD